MYDGFMWNYSTSLVGTRVLCAGQPSVFNFVEYILLKMRNGRMFPDVPVNFHLHGCRYVRSVFKRNVDYREYFIPSVTAFNLNCEMTMLRMFL